jgi:AAA family ATP:ADP antiporter
MDYLVDLFNEFLKRAFDIKEGEVKRTLLMFFYIFFIISALLIVKPTATALFLNKFGVEQLPYAFIMVAVMAAVVSTIYSRYLKVYPVNKIILFTLYSSTIAFIIFWALLLFNFLEGWVLYLFYLWVSIFAVLSASQFWILANLVFNAREAKRLFGFIGAGAISGGIFGGYLTTISVEFLGSENLLLICVLFILACVPITKYVWKNYIIDYQTRFQRKKRIFTFADHPINLIRRSRHLVYMASIVGISVLVAKLVDYQFSAIASAEIKDADQLTAFFGFWFSNLNIASLIIQLFVTRRVVGIFGVGTSLFFLPAGIFIGATAIFISPMLWAGILLKINDGSLKQSINKAGMELLALPIPVEIKNQAKSFIDIFVDSFATGISGIILILFAGILGLNIQYISLLTIIFLIAWFYLAKKVRQEYIRSFRIKIDVDKDVKKKIPDLNNESVMSSLFKILETGSDKQIIQILKMIREVQNENFIPAYKKLLESGSADVKIATLRNVHYYYDEELIGISEILIFNDDAELRMEALNYIFEHNAGEELFVIDEYLNHTNENVRNTALLCASEQLRDNYVLKSEIKLKEIILGRLDEAENTTDKNKREFIESCCLRSIGHANLQELFYIIHSFLNSGNKWLNKEAIYSAGLTYSPEFIEPLLSKLDDDELRESSQMALVNYGQAIVDTLITYMSESANSINIKRIIPSILEKLGAQNSVDSLYQYIDHEDITIRNASLKALNNLKKHFPHLKFNQKNLLVKILAEAKIYLDTISYLYVQINAEEHDESVGDKNLKADIKDARKSLVDLLERRLDGNLERIFRLLGLKYPPDDMIEIYKSIQSNKPDIRINAIEFLDNLLEPNLKKIIVPIVESASVHSISQEIIEELEIKIPSEFECLETLLEGKDIKLKIAAMYLISQLKEKTYIPLAEKFLEHSNAKLQNMSRLAVKNINFFN